MGIGGRLTAAVASVALAAAVAVPGPASGADPGRWRLAQADSVPLSYFQGLTHSAAGSWFFDGITVGLFRTDRALVQKASNPSALTPDLTAQGFNHVGDLTWDAREGGRLLLPLECYVPGQPNGGNTCGRGAIGVTDPATLKLRYAVALDPADIAKAMWAEVSPGGAELWTSSGNDLLAYDLAAVGARRPGAASARAAAGRRGPAVGRHRRSLLPRPAVPGRPGRRRAAAVVGRRDRRHAPGARARAARRGGRVRGPRRPRRARRAPALAALAVPAGRREADLRDGAQRAVDLRAHRRRPPPGTCGAGATWWRAARRA